MSAFPRVIPVLLVSDGYLVKPVKFHGDKYIGDPINAVRIFNEKQVDELVICDIDSSVKGAGVNYSLIEEIASEAFMPVGYGGGVSSAAEAQRITGIGIEKVILNSAAFNRPEAIGEISAALGSSSTVVSVDAKKRLTGGWDTYSQRGKKKLGMTPAEAARLAQEHGAGEIIVSAIDRESTFSGYDLKLVTAVSEAVTVPVIALGGASGYADFAPALEAGASAVAAGSMFVLNGKHRAVLITYPTPDQIRALKS
ncbi:AglZ/HisF2 family acetamidino modification protein [Microbacterium sp. KSW4-16]|uniref:AglZ/HisF2 family acetamidino modification protein n=1 Tax=Microbacterium aurugineum TaxID=2851642 RepID=A0ABY4J1W8_9MICO|nr:MULTISPECIES: AglZ/HisF2 family acetamidino modification protein [Microbacterium]MCK8466474.1 AglZ/HisF2 family acetamidino modification protein [Microbacterium aurugineum]QEA29088.1 imidazole glycerol phosphate synthase subunit HisF [Microbacterium sp. CBA3102]TCJ27979.1 imidazole glycerol phosphate synthase subunit HisF [Microbacterium sp. PI-1]UPL18147.1 AglZ/HisF2 family acetamidino modification protein [Microbacterium aurugineum]